MIIPKKILLVEDDADDQLFFTDALEMIDDNISCQIANNGNEALEVLNRFKPEMIFMDLNMPIINGFECLRQIRQEEKFQAVPVVIFTTSRNAHDIEKAKSLGADLFFTKPSNFRILSDKLREIVTNLRSLPFSL
jgi:CheY-like chemotaxis protein